ncbi:hypothetical protein SSX86_029440 [Deinandra increscens subsp. villosa]|uniref:Uncharacterized protein n=1 Tax=Deinandra increscens subsp. villosa TaxID=3103831 RepID=A0AAP0CAG7_9ASTR
MKGISEFGYFTDDCDYENDDEFGYLTMIVITKMTMNGGTMRTPVFYGAQLSELSGERREDRRLGRRICCSHRGSKASDGWRCDGRRDGAGCANLVHSIITLISCLQKSRSYLPMERLDFGKMGYGCKHYRRRCTIRAPCCNEIFGCRHCHNEATNMLNSPSDRHDLVRYDVEQVICSVCDTEQPIARVCTNCGVNMGEYYCEICKFFDDDTDKGQFHCDDCGICRVGGRENFFHCKKCGTCYSIKLRNNHSCVENSMHHHCPICYEYLFDSLKDIIVMKCGHTMHSECYKEMIIRNKYSCPICSKSAMDMSMIWKRMDEEIEATIMPEDYRQKKVWILCNDCNVTSEVIFHIMGQKCCHCNSYNSRTISPPALPEV